MHSLKAAPLKIRRRAGSLWRVPALWPSLCGYRAVTLPALELGDVIRLQTFPALGLLVGDLGALIEALEAITRYTAVMDEDVLATLIRGDEAVAFIITEPLYRSLGHTWSPPFFTGAPPQQKSRSSHTVRAALLTHHKTHIYLLHPYYTTNKAGARTPWPGWCEGPVGTEGGSPGRTTDSNTVAIKCC